MARYTGPKHKVSRREGVNLTGTMSRSLERRMEVLPGGHLPARRTSDYAVRLRMKQRVKRQYGMTERQFRRFFQQAQRMPGPSGDNLMQLLERRLDNVVYRLGFARTRPMARQLVSHRHVLVNDRPINIPSFTVKPGDTVKLAPAALQIPTVHEELEAMPTVAYTWLERDGSAGRVTSQPSAEDVEPDIRAELIVEYYAR